MIHSVEEIEKKKVQGKVFISLPFSNENKKNSFCHFPSYEVRSLEKEKLSISSSFSAIYTHLSIYVAI